MSRDLQDRVFARLDRRLLTNIDRPVAVALSGGGDSVALTLLADAWARRADRSLVIFTVDHRLQPQSRSWTEACAALADRLERPFRALAWVGDKPATGVPAAARRARHALLAEATRAAGAEVLLMGHTADDVAEAAAMREAGGTTPSPREWAASPVWPEGRAIFVLRPMLGVTRAELRAWLQARGEAWIEDPANADLRYARSRARASSPAPQCAAPLQDPGPLTSADMVTDEAGMLVVDRSSLRGADPAEVLRLIGLACVCAGGGERRPAADRLARLAQKLQGAETFIATLAGARIEAGGEQVRIFREAGERARGGLRPASFTPKGAAIWDGRFELIGLEGGDDVRPLAGLARRLPRDQQAALKALPPAARRALPAVVAADGRVACPVFTGKAKSLALVRLRAAAGLVSAEEP